MPLLSELDQSRSRMITKRVLRIDTFYTLPVLHALYSSLGPFLHPLTRTNSTPRLSFPHLFFFYSSYVFFLPLSRYTRTITLCSYTHDVPRGFHHLSQRNQGTTKECPSSHIPWTKLSIGGASCFSPFSGLGKKKRENTYGTLGLILQPKYFQAAGAGDGRVL